MDRQAVAELAVEPERRRLPAFAPPREEEPHR